VAKAVVAIPVRDEAERVGACSQRYSLIRRMPLRLILTTASTRQKQSCMPLHHLRFALEVVSEDLPAFQAGAGRAPRLALQLAAKQGSGQTGEAGADSGWCCGTRD
jgi:hypothetical protein